MPEVLPSLLPLACFSPPLIYFIAILRESHARALRLTDTHTHQQLQCIMKKRLVSESWGGQGTGPQSLTWNFPVDQIKSNRPGVGTTPAHLADPWPPALLNPALIFLEKQH